MTSSVDGSRPVGDRPTSSGAVPVSRPGWPEITVAAAVYLALFAVTAVVLRQIPDEKSVAQGLAGFALSAVMGLGAFAAAFALRIRALPTFGVRRVAWRPVVLGLVIGVAAWWLNIVVSVVYTAATGDSHAPQADYQAAGDAGAVALLATLLLGAVATPIGEELAFRGVLANALNRYGPGAGILLSAAVFALAHGVNVVLPVAFVIGVLTAVMFRRTGSVWPGVAVHLANNASSILMPLLLARLLPSLRTAGERGRTLAKSSVTGIEECS